MKKFYSYGFILVFFSNLQVGSAQITEWITHMGGTGEDMGRCVATDASGNVYTTGHFKGTADFNPDVPGSHSVSLQASGSNHDIFITKQDAAGRLIWAKRYGGTSEDRGLGIVADPYGHLYITGQTAGTAVFDPGTGGTVTSTGTADVFLLKIDTAGNFIWVKTASGPGEDYAFRVALDPWGGVYLAGRFNSGGAGLKFDNITLVTNGQLDAFVAKSDTAGNFIWANKIGGGSTNDKAHDISVDHQGGVYVAGSLTSNVTLTLASGATTDLRPNGGEDAWVAKLDTGGNYRWAHIWGSSNNDIAWSVATDEDCNVYVCGSFIGTVDFDPGSGNESMSSHVPSARSVFWSKLDSVGKFVTARSIMMSDGNAMGITVDKTGNVYMAGGYKGSAIFGTTTSTSSGSTLDGYLAKWNAVGDFEWVVTQNGSGENFMYDVTCDDAGNVYTTGYIKSNTINSDGKNFTLNGTAGDILVFKVPAPPVTCVPSYFSFRDTACNQYDFHGTICTTSGEYKDTFVNTNNCDSIVTLHLVINQSSVYSFSETACDSFIFQGHTLKQSGTYRDTITNAAGCDSVIILDLEIRNSTSAILDVQACDSFVLDGTVYRTTSTYRQVLTNAAGCDSLVTLNLDILGTSQTITEGACDSFFYNGIMYRTSGVYAHAFKNVSGCDSLVSLHLTIKHSTRHTLTESACGSYMWVDTTYDETGTYSRIFQNAAGCDSFVILDLTVLAPDVEVTQNGRLLTASLGFDHYQWLDCNDGNRPVGNLQIFDVQASGGRFAVAVTLGACMDTSDCITIDPLSVSDFEAAHFGVYPNPVADFLFIEASLAVDDMTSVDIRCTDIHGKSVVLQPIVQGGVIRVDMTHLSSGMYFLDISTRLIQVRHKIMKL